MKGEQIYERIIKNCKLRGGGASQLDGIQEFKKSRCQAVFFNVISHLLVNLKLVKARSRNRCAMTEQFSVILNLFQDLISGRLENKPSPFTLHPSLKKPAFTLAEGATHVAHFDNVRRVAFTLAEGATHVAHFDNVRRAAFTLAEVLITLGIIGIVAALTMPSLVSYYQRKTLETQFKKAYSVLSQAMLPVKSEFITCPADDKDSIRQFLFEQFNKVSQKKITSSDTSYDSFKTYNKTITDARIHANCLDNAVGNVFDSYGMNLPDGMRVSFCTNRTYGNMISIDINGSGKGPNAFGHDLFFFHLNLDNCNLEPMKAQWRSCTEDEEDCVSNGNFKWTTGSCSKDSDASENGFACTQYAIANTCPDNPGKGYFDCLP